MSKKKHQYIELTPERIKALQDERQRTRTGSHKLLKKIDAKYGLTIQIIEHWLSKTKTAREDQYQYVLKCYAALPSYVALNDERIDIIRAEIDRTALSLPALLKKAERLPAKLNAKIAQSWLSGTKFAKENHYAFVIELFRSQETNIVCVAADLPPTISATDTDYHWLRRNKRPKQQRQRLTPPQKFKRPQRISITDDMRALLNAEIERTDVCIRSLVRIRPKSADKISEQKLSFWRHGRTKSANALEWEYIMSTLANRPDK